VSKVHVPTLVVWGEYDWIMDAAIRSRFVRLVGLSPRLLVVPRADHSFSPAIRTRRPAFSRELGNPSSGTGLRVRMLGERMVGARNDSSRAEGADEPDDLS